MLELFKIIVPFILGLIPFFISIVYKRKDSEEIFKQQYRLKFYDRQFESLIEINIALNSFHKAMHYRYSTFGISSDWVRQEENESIKKLYQDNTNSGAEALIALSELHDRHSILLPAILLSTLHEYISFGSRYFAYDILKDTQYAKDINLVQSKDDFMKLWADQNNRFNQLVNWMRMLIGVEGISDKIFSQVKKQDGKHTITVRDYKID